MLQAFGGFDDVVILPEVGILELRGLVAEDVHGTERLGARDGHGGLADVRDDEFVDHGVGGGEQALLPVAVEAHRGPEILQAALAFLEPVADDDGQFPRGQAERDGLPDDHHPGGLGLVGHVQGHLDAGEGEKLAVDVQRPVVERPVHRLGAGVEMDDELEAVADVGGHAHLELVQGQLVLVEQDFGILHHVESDGLRGAALHLHAQGVGPALAQQDAAFLEGGAVAVDRAVIARLVKPGDRFGDVDVSVPLADGFPVEAFQQLRVPAVVVLDPVDGFLNDFPRVAGDDGRFRKGHGFRCEADAERASGRLLPERPVAEVREDDLRDGLVRLDGEIAVRIGDGGVMAAGHGDVYGLHRASGHRVDDVPLHRIAQPDGVRLAVQGHGAADKGNQYQELTHKKKLFLHKFKHSGGKNNFFLFSRPVFP